MKIPTLFVLPNMLDPELPSEEIFPPRVEKIVRSLDGLIAESEKGAHLFLRRFKMRDLPISLLNEHTPPSALKELLGPLLKGQWWGLISDCGMPCLADPGSDLIRSARLSGIHVDVVLGPSSILIALILSGLPCQRFSFHGYLPRDEKERTAKIVLLAKRAAEDLTTQLFIEAPYRGLKLFDSLLNTLPDKTQLCIAADLTLPSQYVVTQTVSQWKRQTPPELKRPTLFLFS